MKKGILALLGALLLFALAGCGRDSAEPAAERAWSSAS